MWQLAYEIPVQTDCEVYSIVKVDIDISMDTESEPCIRAAFPLRDYRPYQLISTFHIDRLIISPGWLAVGKWNSRSGAGKGQVGWKGTGGRGREGRGGIKEGEWMGKEQGEENLTHSSFASLRALPTFLTHDAPGHTALLRWSLFFS